MPTDGSHTATAVLFLQEGGEVGGENEMKTSLRVR